MLIKALAALWQGLILCLKERPVRRLALWPWGIGAFVYVLSLGAAYWLYGPLLLRLTGVPDTIWDKVWYWLVWLALPILLFSASAVITLLCVLLATAVFQTEIAIRVFEIRGVPVSSGDRSFIAETWSSLRVQLVNLLWMVPLMVFFMLLGLIPFFTPIAIIGTAWILAYQFIDVALEVLRASAATRLRFALRNFLALVCFGLALVLCWSIPFLGILLTPAASAGAAWLLSDPEMLNYVLKRSGTISN